MDYQIALSPNLEIEAAEFVAVWNETPDCYEYASADLKSVDAANYPIDASMIEQGVVFLADVAGTITVEGMVEMIKEQVGGYLKSKLGEEPPAIQVDTTDQPDGSILFVVHKP